MLAAFFHIAMVSPVRQHALRRAVVVHIVLLCALGYLVQSLPQLMVLTLAGQALIGMAIVEAAVLAGWRLTQLPKSQSLEFLLTSPVQPRRLFVAEALVGLSRYALLHLSGLPILLLLCAVGLLQTTDLCVFFVLPFVWGVTAALGLIVWSYETRTVKRVGEIVAIVCVLVYLVVGVLAGERLREWLMALPPALGQFLFDSIQYFHDGNPFGVVAYWTNARRIPSVAWEMFIDCTLAGIALSMLFMVRASFRLRGHFADRHYRPFFNDRPDEVNRIGESPLSWWAVKRVMEFSGRVNIWLAGGFSLIYACYILAGDDWPPWMGKLVFQIFEKMGGVPGLIMGLVILSAVPAAFQYGLWDSSSQDRCRRLELLLLTELDGRDYWNASLAAALKRGRGYFFIAVFLWLALLFSGRIGMAQMAVSVLASLLVWSLAFLLGFIAFSSGHQANGLGSFLTLGMPLLTFLIYHKAGPAWAMLLPHGLVYAPLVAPVQWPCMMLIPYAGLAWFLRKRALGKCESELRKWYDKNQGTKAME